jgi:alpha-methylacyl-CoA racemase
MQADEHTLHGALVVDLSRYLPGAFASRELLRLGARVVRVEQPGGDPMRLTSPEWHDELNAGKESVVCDLPAESEFAQALLARADVVLESFRPGVTARLGVGPDAVSERAVYCSITGFGIGGRHEQRAGHDLNYLGWAGALGAVTEILAALLRRERSGRGGYVVVSMTHGSRRLASRAPVLTRGYACYSMYSCADGRLLTVGALEPRFFARLCELLDVPELAERQFEPDQEPLRRAVAERFARRPLDEWLALVDGEDVCVGPVATFEEAAREFAAAPAGRAPAVGEHTAAWRRELGF